MQPLLAIAEFPTTLDKGGWCLRLKF